VQGRDKAQSSGTLQLSVVIPVYGCAACLRPLRDRLQAVLEQLGSTYEIVFVDDRSPDGAWEVLVELCRESGHVRVLRLSRNFGQHAAITAGMAHARGEWVVVMDCDLQDPPEEIPRMLKAATEGFDGVLARRKEKKHSLLRRGAAKAFFALVNSFNSTHLEGEFGSFSMISRKVVDAFLQINDRERHYLFILRWLGFRYCEIEYEHGQRYSGESSYTLRALLRHALSGIFFQTTSLLRWIVYLGFWVSFAGLALAGYFVYQYLAHSIYPGWTSLAVLILLIGGFIITSTGVAALYIGRIFEQVKGRPLYVVDRYEGES
jgi:polyisoprenyl-phosphate glycosyltransferase